MTIELKGQKIERVNRHGAETHLVEFRGNKIWFIHLEDAISYCEFVGY